MTDDQIQFFRAQNGWLAIYRQQTKIAVTEADCDALMLHWRSGAWAAEMEQAEEARRQAYVANGMRNSIGPTPHAAGAFLRGNA